MTPPPENFPDEPAAAMAALGVETDPSALPPSDALDALRDRIVADLEEKQGPFRNASFASRYWPFALALVFAAFALVLLKPSAAPTVERLAASLIAGLAGLTCLLAAAYAPTKPGRGERIATIGLVLGVIALTVEAVIASTMPETNIDLGAPCAISMVAAAILPMAALFLGLKRAGLPVRRRHAAGMAAAAMAMAGATVWMHCPAQNVFHLLSGHIAIPLLIAIGLSIGIFYMFAPRSTTAG